MKFMLMMQGTRKGWESLSSWPPDDACARVIVDAVLSIGLDTLTGGRRAFVNMSRDMLLRGAPTLLPRDQVVIELLEDVRADPEVIDACTALKRAGYAIALDDFAYSDDIAGLIPLADYIKVDFLATKTPADRARPGLADKDARAAES